ncbi:MAG: ABC transporter ATP-binding protein [Beijerinckiaceae bacterium]
MSIAVKNLWKHYGETAAVAGIDLEVPEGEMLVLLGPSGCGKTTTMRCIAGLEEPDIGSISIGGQPVFDRAGGVNTPVNRRNVGMVFQSYAIWPHMSVFENVAFSLEMEKRPREEIRRRVGEILELVGLAGFEERGASYLSGGQMQRVALARSLVMRPAVLLFDEPLSNLDARLRDHLRVQLREIQTELKISSVYVTHDQREALALADRIVMMQAGKILQSGDPVSLFNSPQTAEIAEFLGYSNIFPARLAGEDNGLAVAEFVSGGRKLKAAAGQRCDGDIAVCVRPDDVHISSGEEGAGSGNVLGGTIILASFMGTHMQYRVRAGAGEIWEILSTDVKTLRKLGETVQVHVDPAHVKLLPTQ